jgi:hypothetical protein
LAADVFALLNGSSKATAHREGEVS